MPVSGKDSVNVEAPTALHAHPAARNMIISPAKGLK
jgi:hypothetical protein